MLVIAAARGSRIPGKRGGKRRNAGFTLIEVMVVVALLAIVSAIGAPSFRSFIGTMNSKSAAFDLINDLTVARSEAIKRNRNTSMVPVGGDWAKGWQVQDAGGAVLRERPALTSALSVSGAAVAGVQFRPNGRLSADTDFGNQNWSISSTISGVTARCVIISPTGSARSKPGVC
ncbi:MAG: GspH/FimT family pseudopilin [Rubrivivax sp.]